MCVCIYVQVLCCKDPRFLKAKDTILGGIYKHRHWRKPFAFVLFRNSFLGNSYQRLFWDLDSLSFPPSFSKVCCYSFSLFQDWIFHPFLFFKTGTLFCLSHSFSLHLSSCIYDYTSTFDRFFFFFFFRVRWTLYFRLFILGVQFCNCFLWIFKPKSNFITWVLGFLKGCHWFAFDLPESPSFCRFWSILGLVWFLSHYSIIEKLCIPYIFIHRSNLFKLLSDFWALTDVSVWVEREPL